MTELTQEIVDKLENDEDARTLYALRNGFSVHPWSREAPRVRYTWGQTTVIWKDTATGMWLRDNGNLARCYPYFVEAIRGEIFVRKEIPL